MDAVTVGALLARTPRLFAEHVQALFAAAGVVERLTEPQTLTQVAIPAAARDFLALPDEAAIKADLDWIARSGARLLLSCDSGYPAQLLQAPGAPPVLFALGETGAVRAPQLAMVGSRSPTPAGRRTARDFAACFARAGLTITSGLAVGIDGASHEGALLGGGKTVAVCASGLDQIYPTQHRELAARIRQQGVLISEFPPRTPPARANFPRRNRLISGLALGTLVIEAAQRSGSLITARLAADQGREVFAVPGSIYNPLARGCHKLIRDGATLTESPADVLCELKIPFAAEVLAQCTARHRAAAPLDKEYEMLLDAVGFEPATVDVLALRTGLPGASIASMLLVLELEGRIEPYSGGRYGRIP